VSSPRSRGWTPAGPTGGVAAAVVPALAGVDPPPASSSTTPA